jgi:hypothetical protein
MESFFFELLSYEVWAHFLSAKIRTSRMNYIFDAMLRDVGKFFIR